MVRILILYHSKTGNTERMAGKVAEGASSIEDTEVTVRKIADAHPEDLLDAEAIVIGSPTYYGHSAAPVRQFLDQSVRFHEKLAGKVGGAFASSGNIGGGNETTILDILHALLIHGMIVQGAERGDHYGPVSIGKPDERAERQCVALGERVALLAKRLAKT